MGHAPDQAVGRERVAERVARMAGQRAAGERARPLPPQLQRLHRQLPRQPLQPRHLRAPVGSSAAALCAEGREPLALPQKAPVTCWSLLQWGDI